MRERKTVSIYCNVCCKFVRHKEGIVVDKKAKTEYKVYLHKTKTHESIYDKDLTDLIQGELKVESK